MASHKPAGVSTEFKKAGKVSLKLALKVVLISKQFAKKTFQHVSKKTKNIYIRFRQNKQKNKEEKRKKIYIFR